MKGIHWWSCSLHLVQHAHPQLWPRSCFLVFDEMLLKTVKYLHRPAINVSRWHQLSRPVLEKPHSSHIIVKISSITLSWVQWWGSWWTLLSTPQWLLCFLSSIGGGVGGPEVGASQIFQQISRNLQRWEQAQTFYSDSPDRLSSSDFSGEIQLYWYCVCGVQHKLFSL